MIVRHCRKHDLLTQAAFLALILLYFRFQPTVAMQRSAIVMRCRLFVVCRL